MPNARARQPLQTSLNSQTPHLPPSSSGLRSSPNSSDSCQMVWKGWRRIFPASTAGNLREDFAAMADEGDAGARQAALGHRIHRVSAARMAAAARGARRRPLLPPQALRSGPDHALPAFFGLPLAHDAEVMRGAGRLQLQLAAHLGVVHPVEHRLVLLRRDLLVVGDLHTAADRHEQEQMQGDGADFFGQGQRLRHLVDVVPGDGGVDLERQPDSAQMADTRQRAVERPGPRKISCVAASAPSKLTLTRRTPASFSRWATSRSMSVALVARATISPALLAWAAMSKMSGRKSGRPRQHEIGRHNWPGCRSSGTPRRAQVLGSSLSATVMRRQWMQLRLQPAVVSQKTRRGAG